MWSYIVIEGYCFAFAKEGKCPCGQVRVTTFCLENGHCPHFAYANSNEREAAIFVPIYLFIWDKVKCLSEEIYWKLKWYFWDKWFFRKTWVRFQEYMKANTVKCPAWDAQLEKSKVDFPEWFKKAKAEEVKYSSKKTG